MKELPPTLACLYCGSSSNIPTNFPRATSFNSKVFSYRRCLDCDLVFVNPVPNEVDYIAMYANSYHDSFYFRESGREFVKLDQVFQQHAKGSHLLDFGCGDGSLLKYFADRGFIGTGVEYAPELVARLSAERGHREKYMIAKEFWSSSELFDIIHLGDVLEHIGNPIHHVEALIRRLKPNTGILVVEGPLEDNSNAALAIRKIVSAIKISLAPTSLADHAPYHVTFSNAKNQRQFFERLDLHTLLYSIAEQSWPYPSKPSCRPGAFLKFSVGAMSISLSKAVPLQWGNRFTYVGLAP
jgi:2-polyprenyl-3-methyl-5-hydroxy-6-metoxy-1,4-benzoquinol methylase